ncbi:fam-c protein [Plasmodium vinckei lentum]|uniref:Fam-c protein n=1 Tax=Plasmodium vinckei lentum TaxID=138297 RepID=A0A6V7SKL3_PLAVN|nr:fam-c protein [Plasmodium vinckei lentum]
MNKRTFSLVCIALYALLDASIHCSQKKEYDVGNENVRGAREINRSNEQNGIQFNQKIQLENNDPKDADDKDDDEEDEYDEDEEDEYDEDEDEEDEEDECSDEEEENDENDNDQKTKRCCFG